jgi:hypothetical protein
MAVNERGNVVYREDEADSRGGMRRGLERNHYDFNEA